MAPPSDYARLGLGPLPSDAGGAALYLDLLKRAVANVLYEDRPGWFYDHHNRPIIAPGFSLERRVLGEDSPSEAHSMVGLCRLDNLQWCVEQALAEGVPGDLVETGVFKGGASVLMRAVLKAHGDTERRVFAADVFAAPPPEHPILEAILRPILWLLAAVPSRRWRRYLFDKLQRSEAVERRFPIADDPSEASVELVMWVLRNSGRLPRLRGTSLDDVRSVFARYGLLDEQVVFLQGFFADTLPAAPIERVAVLRLDGDTYESTRDALDALAHKVSPGGFVIVDDYHAFPECRRAIDEHRERTGEAAELVPIDNLAVYWRVTPRPS